MGTKRWKLSPANKRAMGIIQKLIHFASSDFKENIAVGRRRSKVEWQKNHSNNSPQKRIEYFLYTWHSLLHKQMENEHILVVDDDKVTLRTLERILIRAGYSVILLSLGREAIKIAKDRSPGLIILDIIMPDMDGGDVASVFKNDPETKNIPIIFCLPSLPRGKSKAAVKNTEFILCQSRLNEINCLEK